MQSQQSIYKLVFAVTKEEPLGVLIEPFAVKLTENGQLSYSYSRINSLTYKDYQFENKATENEIIAIKYADNYIKQNIAKKYNRSKKIKTNEFLKELDAHPQKEQIRSFIERNIVKCLDLIIKNNIAFHYKGEPKEAIEESSIKVHNDSADVVFNFNKTTVETQYYLTIRQAHEEISLKGSQNLMITNKPCFLLLNRQLFHFEENFDSNKLKPFIIKDFVTIPKSYEEKYFDTFIYNSIQKFTVKAIGFEINTIQPKKRAILRLEKSWQVEPVLVLVFEYGAEEILKHKSKNLIVEKLRTGEYYTFNKIYRDSIWENGIEQRLLDAGLVNMEESLYTIEGNRAPELTFEEKKHRLINFINGNSKFYESIGVDIVQNIAEIEYFTGNIKLDYSIKEGIDWFDLRIFVEFGDYKIPFIQLRNHILQNKKEFCLPGGEIAIIPDEWFAKYKDILNYNSSDDTDILKIKKHHFTLIEKLESKSKLNDLKKLNNISKLKPPQIPEKLNATLRPYQLIGYNWMYYLKKNELGGCLADDMGLGKTLQTITMLLKIKMDSLNNNGLYTNQQAANPTQLNLFASNEEDTNKVFHTSLVIMPLSLIYNWEEEIARFTPHLKINKHIGSSRKGNCSYFKFYDVILTTYGVVRNDIDFLEKFQFEYIILDESQIIKNPDSKVYKSVKRLQSKYRLVLTGTPIENSLIDLWTQMNFLNPGILGGLDFYKNEFVTPIEKHNNKKKQNKLKDIIAPFMLRRTKETVAKDLPPLTEKVYYCEMTEGQKSLYEEKKSEIRNFIIENVAKHGTNKSRFIILKGLMQLRLLSNHPDLLAKEGEYESGKFCEVIRNLENLIAENHKVLIFSQFVKHLSIFENYFSEKGMMFSKITGSMNDRERKEMIKHFQNNEENKLFFISLKAGGVGLNLTAADYVFLLDPWWNPAAESQAINRAHRIGQKKNVMAYKFITKESIEEKIYLLQQKKSALANIFVNNNNPLKFFSNEEIYQLFQ